jgi:hypothetical protein
MQDVQDDIRCMLGFIILLEKYVHMPCSLNVRDYLVLQLLQVQLVCYGVIHKDQYS